jgi:rhodanese-related sulfurtransferase
MFGHQYPKVPQVTAELLKEAIDANEKMHVIDVRTSGELARGKIKGCIHIPLDEIRNKIENVIPDKTSKIYVYCLSGSRSVFAVSEMRDMGYTNVFDVASGILAWRIQRYPLEVAG